MIPNDRWTCSTSMLHKVSVDKQSSQEPGVFLITNNVPAFKLYLEYAMFITAAFVVFVLAVFVTIQTEAAVFTAAILRVKRPFRVLIETVPPAAQIALTGKASLALLVRGEGPTLRGDKEWC